MENIRVVYFMWQDKAKVIRTKAYVPIALECTFFLGKSFMLRIKKATLEPRDP